MRLRNELDNRKCAQWMLECMQDVDFPTLRKLNFMNKWIRLEERLPSDYQRVIIYDPEAFIPIRIAVYQNWKEAVKQGISHWMQLPEIPK